MEELVFVTQEFLVNFTFPRGDPPLAIPVLLALGIPLDLLVHFLQLCIVIHLLLGSVLDEGVAVGLV